MSKIQSKNTYLDKNEKKNHSSNEKRQSTDVNTEMISVLELSDKNFKIIIIKMLQWAVTDSHETNDNIEKYIQENLKNNVRIELA